MVTAAALGPVEIASAADRQKQVLVLYSTRRDAQIVVVGDRELPRILEKGLSSGLDYYSEFIDQPRFPDTDYQPAFRDFLRSKYAGHAFDVIIAMDNVSLEFVDKNRAELFSAVPVIFFSNRSSLRRPANSTGVAAEPNLSGTLTLAAKLQPDMRHVFVISGANDAGGYQRAARAQFRAFEPRFAFTYLSGLTRNELGARLASLPEHSIVYYLVVDRDGINENFHPLEYLDRIAAIASAPVYSWVDSAMDHGIVGGSLKNQLAQTRAIAELALRVLRGERADSIPLSAPDLNVTQVDWRQLRRWGIREARVPPGTLIRFREPSAWDRYKVYILGAAAVLLAQTTLIAGLLVQRKRRRQAEEQVRVSQVHLRDSYDRIRDLGGRLLNAQETERAWIARELHDDIGQQMALLEVDLELLLGGAVQDDAEELAGAVLNLAQRIARSVHDLSHRLHPAKLRLIGLVGALRGLQRELSTADVAITLTDDNVPPTLPPDVTLCLFRVVQEALQNALKCSGAHQVSVDLRGGSGVLTLTIADDGVGFDVEAAWGKGLGLISIGERLEAIGGAFEIHSRPGAGTRLEATVPLRIAPETVTAAVSGMKSDQRDTNGRPALASRTADTRSDASRLFTT
jgi:signal transduction histidine kinase